jgi:predicted transcriptional regulator of viral defense system
MNHASLVQLARELPWFDLALLVQSFDEPREAIRVQLSRWMAQGKVIGLRRGMYTLPDPYRRRRLPPALLARDLYRPSYLTSLWALAHDDLIPERVAVFTSVTPRAPRRFENAFGVFEYRHVKQQAFFGYRTVGSEDEQVFVAEPEKALLDHWHLTAGEWTVARLEEMRYQHTASIEGDRLRAYAGRYGSPRLARAAARWLRWRAAEEEGTVTV